MHWVLRNVKRLLLNLFVCVALGVLALFTTAPAQVPSRTAIQLNATDTKVDMNQPVVLGEFQNTPNVYATLVVVKFKVNTTGTETTDATVFSVSYVLVRNRLIFAYVYRKYLGEQDAAAVVQSAKRWNDQIVAANSKP